MAILPCEKTFFVKNFKRIQRGSFLLSPLGPEWGADEKRISKMVFIGIDLPKDILVQGLEQSLI